MTILYRVYYTVYMPQQTIYIRQADMPKWKALKNKSEFLSNALNGQGEPMITLTAPQTTTSIKEQIEALGYGYDPKRRGEVWDYGSDAWVPYTVINGKVSI